MPRPHPQVPEPAPEYLLRAVHAVPGFVLQEVLLPEVTLPTLGTLEGFLPSVLPARRRGHGCRAQGLPLSSPRAPSGYHRWGSLLGTLPHVHGPLPSSPCSSLSPRKAPRHGYSEGPPDTLTHCPTRPPTDLLAYVFTSVTLPWGPLCLLRAPRVSQPLGHVLEEGTE